MFIFKYQKKPNYISCAKQQINNIKHHINNVCSKPSRSTRHIKNVIKSSVHLISSAFQFNPTDFLSDNFEFSNAQHALILKSQMRKTNFYSSNISSPWQCNSKNVKLIVNTIFAEADKLHRISNSQLTESPYKQSVYIASMPKPKVHINNTNINESDTEKQIRIAHQINQGKHVSFDYDSGYRALLKPLWSPYHTRYHFFTATYSAFCEDSCHGNKPACLLTHIHYQGRYVAQHCWVFDDDMKKIVNSEIGKKQYIGFYATVSRYFKHKADDFFLDFNLTNLRGIQAVDDYNATGYNSFGVTDSKAKLLKLVSQHFDTTQLKCLLINTLQHKHLLLQSVQNEINPLTKQLAHLQSIKKSLLSDFSGNKAYSRIKISSGTDDDKKKPYYPIHHYKQPVKHYSLLQLVALLWTNKLSIPILRKNKYSYSALTGLGRRLENYANRSGNKTLQNYYHEAIDDASAVNNVRCLYKSYKFNQKRALEDFYNPNVKLTIKQIENKHHLASGELRALRNGRKVVKSNA